jgi:hypothetical protein
MKVVSRTLDISDDLYARLEVEARSRGLTTIERLLEQWESQQAETLQRQEVVSRIDALRRQIEARYGQMPDSAALVREDREHR